MSLDIRTLIVSVALATAFCAGARILLWRLHPAIPGLGRWALAGACTSLALGLIVSKGAFQWLPSLSLAQLAMGVGLLLTWDGFRRFADCPPLSGRAWLILTIFVVAVTAIAASSHSLKLISVANALLVAAFSALIARELFAAAKPLQIAMRATAWLFAANAVFFVARAGIENRAGAVASAWSPDGLTAVVLIWSLALTISITLGMVLMTSERLQTDLDAQVHRDPLTGALNRRAFSLIAENEMLRCRRQGRPVSVLMIDLDNFKRINDNLGHGVGDDLLRQLVMIAEQVLRGQDVFCRFGGEEFVALLPDTTAEQALQAGERLRIAFAERTARLTHTSESYSFDITASVGVAELAQGEEIGSLLRRADEALYRAKHLGRNRSELADDIPAPQPSNDEYTYPPPSSAES